MAHLKRDAHRARRFLDLRGKRDHYFGLKLIKEARILLRKIARWNRERLAAVLAVEKYLMQRKDFKMLAESADERSDQLQRAIKELTSKKRNLEIEEAVNSGRRC